MAYENIMALSQNPKMLVAFYEAMQLMGNILNIPDWKGKKDLAERTLEGISLYRELLEGSPIIPENLQATVQKIKDLDITALEQRCNAIINGDKLFLVKE